MQFLFHVSSDKRPKPTLDCIIWISNILFLEPHIYDAMHRQIMMWI